MKKYVLLIVAVCMGVCGCQKIEDESASNSELLNNCKKVQFVMKGLSVDYGTRATLASEGMTDLYVWEGQTLLCHQVSTDADFGSPTVSLSIGAHDLTFVASKSEGQSWTDGVWSCSKVKDTFGAVLSYTVSSSSSSKQVELIRINCKLKWTIEDAVPATVSKATVSVAQCYGLDASLNGVSSGTFSPSFDLTSVQGAEGVTLAVMVLPEKHGESCAVSPSISFDNGVSYTTECEVVANVVTNIHGEFFSGQGGLQMSLDTDWGEQQDVDLK